MGTPWRGGVLRGAVPVDVQLVGVAGGRLGERTAMKPSSPREGKKGQELLAVEPCKTGEISATAAGIWEHKRTEGTPQRNGSGMWGTKPDVLTMKRP